MTITEVRRRIAAATGHPVRGRSARCPSHDDKTASLSVGSGDDGRVLLHCFAGCTAEDICAKLGIGVADLMPPHRTNGHAPRPTRSGGRTVHGMLDDVVRAVVWNVQQREPGARLSRSWMYTAGVDYPVAAVVRIDLPTPDGERQRKEFRPVCYGSGGWALGDPPGLWPLYRLPHLAAADAVHVTEGEKCADALASLGYAATTSAHGAQAAAKTNWTPLAGKNLILWPDNDDAGGTYVADVARLCWAAGVKSLKVVRLPDLPEHGDIVDWLDARDAIGQDQLRAQLDALIAAAPEYEPPAPPSAGADASKVEAAGEFGSKRDERRGAWSVMVGASDASATEYPLTDAGNAERLRDLHGRDLRYCPGIGWLVWSGKLWTPDPGAAMEKAKSSARKFLQQAVDSPLAGEAKAKLIRFGIAGESCQKLVATLKLAESDPRISVRPEQLDADPWALNCRSGTINLRDGTQRPHDRADVMTKTANVDYDPDATCPLFDSFLARIFASDSALIEYVIRVLGLCLAGDITAQHMFIFWGDGANGKSTLLDVVQTMMGGYAGSAPEGLLILSHHEEHPTELADLQGKRLVNASETDGAGRLRLQLIKRLTGDATVKARRMRQDYFEFARTHKIILRTNHKPRVNEDTEAAWRRIRLVPFGIVIPAEERDPRLGEKLLAESSGILNRLLDGCLAWQRDGLAEPPAVRDATGLYREESDPLAEWLTERCTLEPGAWELTSALYANYGSFTESGGGRPLTRKAFTERLAVRGLRPEQRNAGRGWTGIQLTADGEPL
ncbi:MAG: phage/plasmid primase, P4 family [Planctomycetes bacterium]|nr:phage/plasmid primase, P4 family [Planctomycetota bacterium]